jgi:hypothetical protein
VEEPISPAMVFCFSGSAQCSPTRHDRSRSEWCGRATVKQLSDITCGSICVVYGFH